MAVFPLTPYLWAQHLATAVEFLGSFHVIILLIYHTYFVWSNIKKQDKQSVSFMQSASISYLGFLVLYCIGCLLLSFGVQTNLGCKYFIDCVSMACFIAKCIIFMAFVEKLNITFTGSIYSFRPSTIKISKIILLIWTSVLIVILFVSGDGYYVPEHDLCAGSYPVWAHGIAIIGDLIIGVAISSTFCRRLIKLQITLQNVSQNLSDMTDVMKQTQKISDLMTKFTVLATLSIFTTLITYIVIFVFELGSFWMITDTMINSWCLLLLFEGNHNIYNFMCDPMEKCCILSRCLSCCSCGFCCAVTPTQIKLSDDNEQAKNEDGVAGLEITKKDTPISQENNDTPTSIEVAIEKP